MPYILHKVTLWYLCSLSGMTCSYQPFRSYYLGCFHFFLLIHLLIQLLMNLFPLWRRWPKVTELDSKWFSWTSYTEYLRNKIEGLLPIIGLSCVFDNWSGSFFNIPSSRQKVISNNNYEIRWIIVMTREKVKLKISLYFYVYSGW